MNKQNPTVDEAFESAKALGLDPLPPMTFTRPQVVVMLEALADALKREDKFTSKEQKEAIRGAGMVIGLTTLGALQQAADEMRGLTK